MTDRERLVELLRKDNCCIDYDCNKCLSNTHCYPKTVADLILADGWMRPPCKVGQTIYYHFQFRNKSILPFTRKAKVKKIYCSNSKMNFIVDVELIDAKEKGIMKSFDFDDFGKTAFCSREEAEKALKGGVSDA